MSDSPPRLLLVAHGTRSAAGSLTSRRIADAVAAARPELQVDLCFLDVAEPSLDAWLAVAPAVPTVLVPVLLSTGYHVEHDIPTAVASYPHVAIARHLGPSRLLANALLDRLVDAGGRTGVATLMVGAGSTLPSARAELAEAARLLGEQLQAEVLVRTIADDLAELAREPTPQVATYLLAEGQFTGELQKAFPDRAVGAPIGTHPALIELILQRYDASAAPRG